MAIQGKTVQRAAPSPTYQKVGFAGQEAEYYHFLTQAETEYFLSFPRKWEKGEIPPFMPVKAAI
jgi:hypothetical protein